MRSEPAPAFFLSLFLKSRFMFLLAHLGHLDLVGLSVRDDGWYEVGCFDGSATILLFPVSPSLVLFSPPLGVLLAGSRSLSCGQPEMNALSYCPLLMSSRTSEEALIRGIIYVKFKVCVLLIPGAVQWALFTF